MEITRRYFCYDKSHKTSPEELKLIGTINRIGLTREYNLYQCPTCKAVQLLEEEVDAKTK